MTSFPESDIINAKISKYGVLKEKKTYAIPCYIYMAIPRKCYTYIVYNIIHYTLFEYAKATKLFLQT